MKWRPVNPSRFQVDGETSGDVFDDQSRVVQASGEIDELESPSMPRLFSPGQSPRVDAFQDPFGDQSPRYHVRPVAEPTYETIIASPQINATPSTPIVREVIISDLPDPNATRDQCVDKYRGYRGNDRDCKVAGCQLRESLIQSISLNIDPTRDPDFDATHDTVPYECIAGNEPFYVRCWAPTTFTWKASALCHKPLYFEQVKLERYGHSWGPFMQPVVSGAHFVTNIAMLPYKMGINPPTECQYALGYYRPGSCSPWLIDPFPISLRGAAYQAGAIFGGLYLFP